MAIKTFFLPQCHHFRRRVFSALWVKVIGARVDLPGMLSSGLFFKKHAHLFPDNVEPGLW